MSFRGRGGDSGGNPNKMDLGDRKFGAPDNDKPGRDDGDRFESSRGRRPFGRGGRPSPGRDRPYDRPRDYGFGRDEPMGRDRSPLRPDDRYSDRYRKDDHFNKRDDHSRKDSSRPFYPDESGRDRFMDSRSRHDGGSGSYNSRFDGPPMPYKGRPMNYLAPPSKGGYFEGFPKPNECEIIVVNKLQRAYAESVEYRVKSQGILVDILFLKDEALLTQTIDDIARRGSLYAMVISPQNETHSSVTVNILHGTPQEHRNMPLEDALKLLSRNFHDYIRSQREHMERERAERGPYIGVVSADREMQFLLRMLADGRWVSLTELNAVIRYLCERRDKMQSEDRGPPRMPIPPADSSLKIDPPFKPKDDIDVSQKEQDLQNRIINLMTQGAPTPASGSDSAAGHTNLDIAPRPNQPNMSPNMGNMRSSGMGHGIKSGRPGLDDNQPGSLGLDSNLPTKDIMNKPVFSSPVSSNPLPDPASTFINFDNPSVQKALDNLIQSGPSLLKNISLSASSVTSTPSIPSSAAGDTSGTTSSNDQLMQRGGMGPPQGSDLSSNQQRNTSGLDMPRGGNMGDMSGPRGGPSLPGLGGMGSGSGRGGYGNIPDMGPRGFSNTGMQDMGRMGPPRDGIGGPPRDGMGGLQRDRMGGLQRDGMGGLPRDSMGGPPRDGMGGPPRDGMGGGPPRDGMGGGPPRDGMGGLSRDGMGGPPRDGMGGPPRDGMGGPPRDGMGGTTRDNMGGPPRDGMGGPPRDGMGGPTRDNMGGPPREGMGGPTRDNMGGPQRDGMGGPPRMGMGPPGGQDRGPPQGMGQGGNFPNQYSKYPGPNQQQGNFPGSYNSGPGMGGMSRPGYGGPPGMGGLRRY